MSSNTKKGKKEKVYFAVTDTDGETIYFEDYGWACDHMSELRADGYAVKYSRVRKVKMTEEQFNNLAEL